MSPFDKQTEKNISAHSARRQGQAGEIRREQVTLSAGKQPKGGLETQLEQRDKRMNQLDEHMLHADRDWHQEQIEKSGPMGVWDAVAQKIEDYVEKREK